MPSESIEFIIDGVEITYREQYIGSVLSPHDHFELRSLNVSETGYKSHFVPSGEVVEAGGYLQYVTWLISGLWTEQDNQLLLF